VPTHRTPPTYLHGERPADDICSCCLLRGRPSVAVGFEACAGRRIRWLCPPAVLVQQAVFACSLFACHAHCPQRSCPRSVCFVLAPIHFASFAPVHSMCARIIVSQGRRFVCQSGPAVCQLQDCPVGSCNTGLQWRPVRRSIFDLPFSLQSPFDPGPWE